MPAKTPNLTRLERFKEFSKDALFIVAVFAVAVVCGIACEALLAGFVSFSEWVHHEKIPVIYKWIATAASGLFLIALAIFGLMMHCKGLVAASKEESEEPRLPGM
jgi:hypothetical protein